MRICNLFKLNSFEIGYDQKVKVKNLLKNEKFYVNKIVKDYGNKNRCIISTKI